MAISWLTVLKNVPWSDVISNAPKVADGAKKLWNNVGAKREHSVVREEGLGEPRPGDSAMVSALRSEVGALEEEIDELRGQMVASSGLIKDLADQNAQLIARVELMRRRVTWIAGGAVLSLALAIAAIAVTLTGV